MNTCLAHRGPDGQGTRELAIGDQSVNALAHRRLSIIDLSPLGAQPMTVHCAACPADGHEQLSMVFNGEIYNYRELRAELEAEGHVFRSATDSEVLLHLYARDGHAMLSRLNGIFALVIHDGRREGRPAGVLPGDLFVARDQLGVKPLYYAELHDAVLFASELKALLRSPEVSRALDPEALRHYVAYLYAPAEGTPLRAVRKLQPGYAMVLRAGKVLRRWSYWDLPYGSARHAGSPAQIEQELRERLSAAVERQLVADVPVGAFLSGGLDSSSIVAMMQRLHPDTRTRCYCIGFESGSDNVDDVPYARRVAAHVGADLEVLTVEADVIDRLEEMLFLLDEPQADPAPLNALLIAERARSDGVKVLLSGAGGDDLLTGYRRHTAVRHEPAWTWLPSSVRSTMGRAARAVSSGDSALPVRGVLRRAAKSMAFADYADDERLVSYFWWNTPAARQSLYGPLLRDVGASADVAQPLLATLSRIPNERDPINRMLYLEAKHFLADHNLNYTDKMGMAAGVEVRVPLLDLEFVEFATRIPSALKQSGSVGKAVFKRAMEPLLPHDVIYRSKSGFGAPLRGWLRNELRERVEDTLSPDSLRRRGLFDPAGVRRLVDLDRAGRVDGSYTIFAMMCIELWCRLFIDTDQAIRPACAAPERVLERTPVPGFAGVVPHSPSHDIP